MSDLLQSGLNWLAGQLQSGVSQLVSYQRGEQSVALPATLGQSEFPRESREGLTVEERTQDFLITVSLLKFGSTVIEPEPGDTITVPGVGKFEVASPGGGAPAWRYSDPYHTLYRIHTREILA